MRCRGERGEKDMRGVKEGAVREATIYSIYILLLLKTMVAQ